MHLRIFSSHHSSLSLFSRGAANCSQIVFSLPRREQGFPVLEVFVLPGVQKMRENGERSLYMELGLGSQEPWVLRTVPSCGLKASQKAIQLRGQGVLAYRTDDKTEELGGHWVLPSNYTDKNTRSREGK